MAGKVPWPFVACKGMDRVTKGNDDIDDDVNPHMDNGSLPDWPCALIVIRVRFYASTLI